MVPINHVRQTLAIRDTWKRVVGIKLAYAGLNCWAMGVGPSSNQRLAIKLVRWAKWHQANIICWRQANITADKMPALTQQMIAIGLGINVHERSNTCNRNLLYPTTEHNFIWYASDKIHFCCFSMQWTDQLLPSGWH